MAKIVIVGGGFAGALAAKELERDYDVTLVDTKDYFEFTPGILRTIVEPGHVKKLQVLHSHYLERAKVLQGSVTRITETHAHVGKERLPYDYLLLAAGSHYRSPFKESDVVLSTRGAVLRNCYDRLCRAKRVLVIGGGPVGVELAAEIAEHYDGKEVTLVQGAETILNRSAPKTIAYATKWLRKRGVTLLLGERIKDTTKKSFTTDKGTKLTPDMTFLCLGIRPTSDVVKKCYPDCLTERGAVKVDDTLRLLGHDRIFVAGDVNDRQEEKLAQGAERQAALAVRNIRRHDAGKPLLAYEPKPLPMIISLGKRAGAFQYKGFVLTGLLPGLLKSFVEWKTMRRYR